MESAGEAATILQALRLRRTSRDYEDRDVPGHVIEDMVEVSEMGAEPQEYRTVADIRPQPGKRQAQ